MNRVRRSADGWKQDAGGGREVEHAAQCNLRTALRCFLTCRPFGDLSSHCRPPSTVRNTVPSVPPTQHTSAEQAEQPLNVRASLPRCTVQPAGAVSIGGVMLSLPLAAPPVAAVGVLHKDWQAPMIAWPWPMPQCTARLQRASCI